MKDDAAVSWSVTKRAHSTRQVWQLERYPMRGSSGPVGNQRSALAELRVSYNWHPKR